MLFLFARQMLQVALGIVAASSGLSSMLSSIVIRMGFLPIQEYVPHSFPLLENSFISGVFKSMTSAATLGGNQHSWHPPSLHTNEGLILSVMVNSNILLVQ